MVFEVGLVVVCQDDDRRMDDVRWKMGMGDRISEITEMCQLWNCPWKCALPNDNEVENWSHALWVVRSPLNLHWEYPMAKPLT